MTMLLGSHGGSTLSTYEERESVNTITIEMKIPLPEEKKEEKMITSNSILCNCYAYVKDNITELPNTKVILNNLDDYGDVAVFYYPTASVYHYAIVEWQDTNTFTISETNFQTCEKSIRVLDRSNIRLLGFYSV